MECISTPDRNDAQAQYRCRVADPHGQQGTANLYVAYHVGCQPNIAPEDTVLPHWTIYGWVAWDKPEITTLPLPPSDSYGSPASARVLNQWPVTTGTLQPDGHTWCDNGSVTFCSAAAARSYIERRQALHCATGTPNKDIPITIID